MTAFRRTAGVAALCAGLMLNAGCQGDGAAQPLPPAESSTGPSDTSSSEPEWQAKYSQQEIDAYDAALDRWEAYEQRSESIWAKGKATPAAADLFNEYFPAPIAQGALRQLKDYESVNVRVEGIPKVYWSMAIRISKRGDSVELRQCVNPNTVQAYQNGRPARRSKKFDRPLLRDVKLGKLPGQGWLIYAFDDLRDEEVRSCDPAAL